jgi:mono/diheme cytochrome c family protein
MALVFPLYRWFEPTSRADARDSQLQNLAVEGETIWKFNCSSCHGISGEGGIAPALNSKQFLQSATNDQISLLVSVGIPGSLMSAFSLDHGGPLTSEQIKAAVTLLRSWEPTAPDNPEWRAMIDGAP